MCQRVVPMLAKCGQHALTDRGNSVVSACGARGRSSSVQVRVASCRSSSFHEGLSKSVYLATKCSNQDGRLAGNEGPSE